MTPQTAEHEAFARNTTRVLFVNVTKRCNVDCPKCYLTPLSRKTDDRLSPQTLLRVLSHGFFSETPENTLVIFQGGEAQLLGRKALTELCDVVKDTLPGARQTAVTNLLTMPPWFVDLVHTHFESRLETTWAAGRKQTLQGDPDRFQAAFRHSLKTTCDAGIHCPINVELNDHTVEAGPDHLIDLMLETGATDVEIDLSIDFEAFRRKPLFLQGQTPVLPPTVPYTMVTGYVLELHRNLVKRGLTKRIKATCTLPLSVRRNSPPFNVLCEDRFLTLNPDGSLTTNPVYSDILETHIGHVWADGMDACLAHPNRHLRIAQERVRMTPCSGCHHLSLCQGGPSHMPQSDGSGECAGLKKALNRFEMAT